VSVHWDRTLECVHPDDAVDAAVQAGQLRLYGSVRPLQSEREREPAGPHGMRVNIQYCTGNTLIDTAICAVRLRERCGVAAVAFCSSTLESAVTSGK
jgi:hypothetical protein